MRTFLLRRLFTIVLVWLGVILLTFLITNVIPSDPVALRLGPKASPEAITFWRHEYGLDQPLTNQFIHYISNLLKGDLGVSIFSGRSISKDIGIYLPATLELALSAILVTLLAGIPFGVLAARRRGSWLDRFVMGLSSFGLAVPLFWLGLVLQLIFYRQIDLLPLDSRITLTFGAPVHLTGLYVFDSLLSLDWQRFASSLMHLVLPTITLSLFTLGGVARMVRASTLENLTADYARMARAKGATEARVFWGHVVRNSLLPTVTVLGNTFNALLAGVFVVEVVFNWPGIGWYATKSILAADYIAVMGVTLVIAMISTTLNLLVDILYGVLDPRIQYS
jgi:peptide/nickel transport system permease protein